MLYFFGIVLIYLIYQIIELNRFSVKKIDFTNSCTNSKFVYLSDVHGKTYGKLFLGKSRLVHKITDLQPQFIILGGDTVSKRHPEQYETMAEFIRQLVQIAPVYYLFGNHEESLEQFDTERFLNYIDVLENMGVHIVRNRAFFPCEQTSVSAYALELPLSQYEKRTKKPLARDVLVKADNVWKDAEKEVGEEQLKDENNSLRILFVHQPAYADDYLELKPDVIFAGHSHGGLVRVPGVGGLVSTELTLFPKYDGGVYHIGEDGKTMLVVSHGLGTHHFHIRVFAPAQLIYVTISSCKDKEN